MEDLIKLSKLNTMKIFGISAQAARVRAKKGNLPGVSAKKNGRTWTYFLVRKKFEEIIGRELDEDDFIRR